MIPNEYFFLIIILPFLVLLIFFSCEGTRDWITQDSKQDEQILSISCVIHPLKSLFKNLTLWLKNVISLLPVCFRE